MERIYTDETRELAQRKSFAESLVRFDGDGVKAAFAIEPDTGKALMIGYRWPSDPMIQAEVERISGSSEAKRFLPSKEKQARDIYALATHPNIDPEARLKAHRLYAEIMQHIEKPKDGPTVNVIQGVMQVPFAASMDEWEKFAKKQQTQLTTPDSRVN